MEKKFKFSGKPITAKLVYAAVIAILCVSAIVVGIVSAASKAKDPEAPSDPIIEGEGGTEGEGEPEENEKEEKQTFISPLVGSVMKEHDLGMPVYSTTLNEWKVHAGIDISTDDGAPVYAPEAGTVSRVYSDPLLGFTVELTHANNFKTRYSNLNSADAGLVSVGETVESGQRIGSVGDSSVSELAEEPHLHFEMLFNDVKVNPLDYLSEASKKASLGIKD